MGLSKTTLVILTLGLVASLVVPPAYAQPADTSPLVAVTGMIWKGAAVVKIDNNPDNIYEIKLVWLTLQNGAIDSFQPMDGWSAEIGSSSNTIQFRAETDPILPGESVKFGIKSDQSAPIFKWIILDDNGDELGSGMLDVAKSSEELGKKEEALAKKEEELRKKEQELLKKEQDLLKLEKRLAQLEKLLKQGQEEKEKPPVPNVPPKIRIKPDVVEPGKPVKIIGQGFTPNSKLTVLLDGNQLARLNINSDGIVKARILLPDQTVKGAHQISASDAEGRAANISLQVEIDVTIVPLTAGVEKQAYTPGELVKITGTAGPGTAVQLKVQNPTGLTILSIAVPVDKDGKYAAFIPLSSDATAGQYQILVTQEDQKFETSYSVQTVGIFDLTVITDKFEYYRGENVIVSGKTLPNKEVVVSIFGPDGTELKNSAVVADNTGSYSVSMPVQQKFPLGEYSAVVRLGNETISIAFSVVPGSVALSIRTDKETYGAGELVRISGKGKANDKIDLIIKLPTVDEVKMSAITKDDGTYTAIWLVSSVAKPGRYVITAQQGDETVTTAFVVTT